MTVAPAPAAERLRAPRRASALAAIGASAAMQVRQNLVHSMTFATGILNPLMMLAVLVLPRTEPLTGAGTTAVLTGSALAAFWAASVWGGTGVLRAVSGGVARSRAR